MNNALTTMLSVTKLTGAAGTVAKYAQHQRQTHAAQADGSAYATGYYADRAPSQWHGTLANELGLQGEVDPDSFQALLDGCNPQTGETLDKRAGQPKRRLGNDLTFSAPKSVSLEALANGSNVVRAAHDHAVAKALEYIETHVISARYGHAGKHSETTSSAAFAVFQHEDARSVDDRVDPDLHSHCIALNMTRGRDGQLRATDLDFGAESVRMHTADMIYKAELAYELKQAGYGIRPTQHGFELAHITDEQITAFSRRRSQVDETLAEWGLSRAESNATQRTQANLGTRGQKSQLSRAEQLTVWHQAGREAGLPRAAPELQQRSIDAAPGARHAADAALAHLSERQSVLDGEQVRLEALRAGVGRADAAYIDAALNDHEQVYRTDAGWVTQAALDRENAIIESVRAGRNRARALLDPAAAEAATQARERAAEFAYSAGQRQAIRDALTGRDQTAAIVGSAGAGKTTALRAIADQAKAAGFTVVGIAPSATAGAELTDAGADTTQTIAGYLARLPQDDAPRYLILDEAGMVSARDMAAVLGQLRPRDRLLMVGDPDQLQAVEAGTPFDALIRDSEIAVSEIREIRRQRNPALRAIAEQFAAGNAAAAVDAALAYAEAVEPTPRADGKITKREKREAIAARTAEKYLTLDPDQRERTLVLSGTNEVRSVVNAKIRAALVADGEIDVERAVFVTALRKTNLTRAQRAQAKHYESGQVMRIAGPGGRTDYTIEAVDTQANTVMLINRETGDPQTVDVAQLDIKKTRLYDAEPMPLAEGERVIFTGNDKALGVNNGDAGRVVAAANGRVQVELDNQRIIEIDAARPLAVESGYCRTVHKAQGATTDRVIVAGEGSRTATAEQAYVAATRQRDVLEIVTDSTDALKTRWTAYANRQTARDAVSRGHVEPPMKQARAQQAERNRQTGPVQRPDEVEHNQWSEPVQQTDPDEAERQRRQALIKHGELPPTPDQQFPRTPLSDYVEHAHAVNMPGRPQALIDEHAAVQMFADGRSAAEVRQAIVAGSPAAVGNDRYADAIAHHSEAEPRQPERSGPTDTPGPLRPR